MKIIANTSNGVIIEATNSEVNEILRSVNGKAIKDLSIGLKIPAIDYAGSITKIKELSEDYKFTNLVGRIDDFVHAFKELQGTVESAANIEV